MLKDDNLIIFGAVVVWDGVNRPEEMEGEKGGLKFSIKAAIPNNAPEVQELQALGTKELNGGRFRGTFPAGGHWVSKPVDPQKYEGALPNHIEFTAVTYQYMESCFLSSGNQPLKREQLASVLYPGCLVDLIVTARSYDNKSKGVGLWLSGLRIADSSRPKLPGCGGIDASKVFGPPVGPTGEPTFPGPPVGGPPVGGPPMPPDIPPAPDFLNPPGGPLHTMTAKAAGVAYEAFIAKGWTDKALIDNGYMLG